MLQCLVHGNWNELTKDYHCCTSQYNFLDLDELSGGLQTCPDVQFRVSSGVHLDECPYCFQALLSSCMRSPVPGLFIVSVLSRLKWGLRPLVEAAILGQFVVQQVGQEMKSQFAGEDRSDTKTVYYDNLVQDGVALSKGFLVTFEGGIGVNTFTAGRSSCGYSSLQAEDS